MKGLRRKVWASTVNEKLDFISVQRSSEDNKNCQDLM
jgi:hypothetical protein